MDRSSGKFRQFRLCCVLTGFCTLLWSQQAGAVSLSEVPDTIVKRLDSGAPQDVIILYDDQDIEKESDGMRRNRALKHEDEAILAFKALRYRNLKDTVDAGFTRDETEKVSDYTHLPMTLKRFRSSAALQKFLLRPGVKAVYENSPIYPHLAYSLPFINQPAVANAGNNGSGQTVAVIDTGIDYNLTAFGSCSAPGTPVGCRVAASVDVTGHNVTLNKTVNNHGTNVAGIVAGVASGARIAAVNAFYNNGSSNSWIITGINWAIANKSAYNINSLNMSLGDNVNYTSPCSNSVFTVPVTNLRNAGIIPIASSGNSSFTGGMSSPACAPGVVSVGAVYDANWNGSFTWNSGCTDSTNGPDKIPCFSNSASFLTILAPGAFITAAGIQMAGTSQASPHVAGAVAVMRSAYPEDSLDQSVTRLTSSGVSVFDSRNGITTPRLNLQGAISPPANDMFANRPLLSGDTGRITANNLNATSEPGEPNHAGGTGGKSVWWNWTPSSSGAVSIDTRGSTFDTLLAVYTGTEVNNLALVAANDNDGFSGNTSSVSFVAQSGIAYQIAVGGSNNATGLINLSWLLEQQADLSLAMSGPSSTVSVGDTAAYDLAITNNGPSSASGVTVTDTLPVASIIDSIPTGCTEKSGTVNCSFGTLSSGGSASARITLHFPTPGSYLNTAQVSAVTKDPVLTNNSAAFSLTDIPAPAEPVPGFPLPLAGIAFLTLTFLTIRGKSGKT
jgi:uncharacterized repeat protein (TIGR01451 family)